MYFFVFREQFKAISFEYIFRNGTRSIPVEVKLRQNLQLHLKFVTATLLYSIYVDRIQLDAANATANRDKIPRTNDTVLMIYKASVRRGPLAYMPKRGGMVREKDALTACSAEME